MLTAARNSSARIHDPLGAWIAGKFITRNRYGNEDLEEQGRLIEQKHGTWISLDTYVYECDGMWECSECGEDFYFEFGTPLECRAYYCPNCGAKMELKGE